MNRILTMHWIKTYLARFETYVRISNLNSEFDVNKYAEDFLIPFLKLVYGWELINLNRSGQKNAKSLDLLDSKRKIGIQVTSETSLEKIKDTLQKYLSSGYQNKVNRVFFYFLREKQKKYSIESILKVTGKRLKFSTSSNILDNADLYAKIESLKDDDKLQQIENLLRKEFSDFKLKDQFSYSDYLDFKEKYKACCTNNFARLNFFGLSIPKKPRELELYALFVKPNFSAKIDEIVTQTSLPLTFENQEKTTWISTNPVDISQRHKMHDRLKMKFRSYDIKSELEFGSLFNIGKHIVILGNPGAGKSSLVKYSICKLIEDDKKIFSDGEVYYYLPIRIELHKYNRFKNDKKGGITDYLIYNLIDEFQLPIPKIKVNYFLENFPILIFFDGLDEIFDIQERINVRNDIENFIQVNKVARSVVTCRYESYEEVQLNREFFKIINVEDFSKEQIEEYVKKWYNIEEVNAYVRDQEIKNCIEQLKDVNEELKQNPLLLALILILYRNEQDLPTSKLEIYEGCAQTLVETRDGKEKKLGIQLKISNKISVFSNLAYWQFSNEIKKEGGKINYNSVRNYIAGHLYEKGEFDEFDSAEEAAKEFLEYAKLRSIYFENKFTHKTFYEYFTAYYIYVNFYSKPSARQMLEDLIILNIGVASWHVILELLLCKIDQSQIDFDVIDLIVDKLLEKKSEQTSYFFSSLLKHLRNISPAKYRILLNNIMNYLAEKNNRGKQDSLYMKTYFENFIALLKIRKYKEAFIKIATNILLNDSVADEGLSNLIAEQNIVYRIKEVTELLSRFTYLGDSIQYRSKMFILHHWDELCDKYKSIKLLESFCSQFGKERVLMNYHSDFGQPIFDGSTRFNWIALIFGQMKSASDFNLVSTKFKSLGIDNESIQRVIRQNALLFGKGFQNIRNSINSPNSKPSKANEAIYEFFELFQRIQVLRNPYGQKVDEDISENT